MATYKTPGVYVKEVPSLPASIVPVPTAVPLFMGYTKLHDQNTPNCGLDSNDCTFPVKITSMREFVERFGGPNTKVTVTVNATNTAIDTAIDNGTNTAALISSVELEAPSLYHILFYSLQLYFKNGGGPCYIISVGEFPAGPTEFVITDDFEAGIEASELIDEPTLFNIPEMASVDPLPTGTNVNDRITAQANLFQELLRHCAKMQDRFAILDPLMSDSADFMLPHESAVVTDHLFPSIITDVTNSFRARIGTLNLSYGAAYYPYLKTMLKVAFEPADIVFSEGASSNDLHDETLKTIMDRAAANNTTNFAYAKLVSPSFLQKIYDGIAEHDNLILPPGAAVLGQIVQTDKTRGVWKAPANISLTGVLSLTNTFKPDAVAGSLEDLNVPIDGQGKAVNAIRQIPGRGIMIMGARTLDANSLEWRYIPVRRLFIFVEESIRKAMDNLVFEPNDANTWNRVKTMISAFLDNLFRDGALLGSKPEQAYFVNVGLGTTMTTDDILNGRLIIEVGLAAVRPAEFIILKFSHKLQES